MIIRTLTYGRYSTFLQNPKSIEDQFRLCQKYAKQHSLTIVDYAHDSAESGSAIHRTGIQFLLDNLSKYDVILCEALDRLSRDQADMAFIYKLAKFNGVKIITVEDGEVSEIHIGVKGTMNTLFLRALADKTRRGLIGKIAEGKSAGGKCFGYDVVKGIGIDGEPIKGELKINQEQSRIVRRILYDYAYLDKSPKTIAKELNEERIPGPSGKEWGASTINGNRRRGTGILNNDLYSGTRVWNRLTYVKHPLTGKRQSRLNPESELVFKEMPELKIVDDELWQAVKRKQRLLDVRESGYKPKRRASYLLSDLIKCGGCGGGVSLVNSTQYGCSRARNKGTCSNRKTINKKLIETAVINAMKAELATEATVKLVVKEYNTQLEKLIASQQTDKTNQQAEISRLKKEKSNLVNAIKQGVDASLVKDELIDVCSKLQQAEETKDLPKVKPLKSEGISKRFLELLNTYDSSLMSKEAMLIMRDAVECVVLDESGKADLTLNPYAVVKKNDPPYRRVFSIGCGSRI